MHVSIEPLSPQDQPVVITLPEFMRRMKDMSKTGGGGMMFMGNMPDTYNVSVNANHSINNRILSAQDDSKGKIAKQAFDLALLSQNMLTGPALTAFVKRSVELIEKDEFFEFFHKTKKAGIVPAFFVLYAIVTSTMARIYFHALRFIRQIIVRIATAVALFLG